MVSNIYTSSMMKQNWYQNSYRFSLILTYCIFQNSLHCQVRLLFEFSFYKSNLDSKNKSSVSQMYWLYSLSSDCSVVVFLTSPLLASLLAIKKATIVINSPEIIIEFQAKNKVQGFSIIYVPIFKNWLTVSKEVQISSSYVLYSILLNDQLLILAVLKTISSLVKK